MATFSDETFVVKKDLNPFILKDLKYSPLFLLALINSRLLSHLYMEASIIAGKDDFRQTTLASLYALPIRGIEFSTAKSDSDRLLKQGQEIYEAGARKNNPAGFAEFAKAQLDAKRADVVHDLLAFLAERMTALNAEKNATAQKFLGDLKDFHGVDAHSLKPKTKLDEFWKLETDGLFAHLHANAKLLAAQNVRLSGSDDEKIRGRFQEAKDQIIPQEAALAFTDALIDQIVYRLYDLTPEEIKLVEGTGTQPADLGQCLSGPVDNVAEVLAHAEGENFKS
jgi:hypothetical protein